MGKETFLIPVPWSATITLTSTLPVSLSFRLTMSLAERFASVTFTVTSARDFSTALTAFINIYRKGGEEEAMGKETEGDDKRARRISGIDRISVSAHNRM